MTKGTKAFRIIVCILLALTMLWSAFFGVVFVAYVQNVILEHEYGIWIAGVSVTQSNQDDILGDGSVSYDEVWNILTFQDANIECDFSIIHSEKDLVVELIGENKFVCKDNESITAIYVSNNTLRKDLSFYGDGTLDIVFENVTKGASGIVADNIYIGSDISITSQDCSDVTNGIVTASALYIRNNSTVVVNNGSAKNSAAVASQGNIAIESGSSLNVNVNPGCSGNCYGLVTYSNMIVSKDSSLSVSIDDEIADMSACINVFGSFTVGRGADVTASSKKAYAIDCLGSFEVYEGAVITAKSAGKDNDICCFGAVVNGGADINGDIDALGGVHNK